MDPNKNPFAPGAGSQPPELAGREAIIHEAQIALSRVIQGRSAQSQIGVDLFSLSKVTVGDRALA